MSQPAIWNIPLPAEDPDVSPEDVAIRLDASLNALLSSHLGASRPSYAVAGTIWHDSDTTEWFAYDGVNDLRIPVLVATAPTAATDPGITGQWAQDADYIYVCTATDTWKRVAIATW